MQAELNFKKMARKAVQNAFDDIVIHGKTALEWLKIIKKLPPNCRLIDANAFVEYLENEFKSGYENDQKSDADMKMLIAKMHELFITEIQKRPTVLENEG